MPRVCLITPGHLATNPRLVKEADALSSAGYPISVIAADFVQWAREGDLSFKDHQWRVVRTLPFGPRAPLRERVKQIIRQKSSLAVARTGIRPSYVVHSAWHPIGPELIETAKRVNADLYIAHYPAALPAAALAAQQNGALYAYDAEDFHLGDWPDSAEYETNRQLVRWIETRYLPQCAYITAASPGIADAYVAAYGVQRPTVVLNVFGRAEAPVEPTAAGSVVPGPSIYWFSQTIGADRGIECAVRAIGRAETRPHLYLRGRPAAGFIEKLQSIAAVANAVDRVHVLPPCSPRKMVRLAAGYDLGLVGETGHTASRRIALTNKLFTYFLAGLPAVMSDIPAHRAFEPEVGGAALLFAVDDPNSLAAAFDALLGKPDRLAAARGAAFRLGQAKLNWDVEKTALLRQIERTVPDHHAPYKRGDI